MPRGGGHFIRVSHGSIAEKQTKPQRSGSVFVFPSRFRRGRWGHTRGRAGGTPVRFVYTVHILQYFYANFNSFFKKSCKIYKKDTDCLLKTTFCVFFSPKTI
jgi:hypothetical protein